MTSAGPAVSLKVEAFAMRGRLVVVAAALAAAVVASSVRAAAPTVTLDPGTVPAGAAMTVLADGLDPDALVDTSAPSGAPTSAEAGEGRPWSVFAVVAIALVAGLAVGAGLRAWTYRHPGGRHMPHPA